jgi:hypothetical protein
MFMRSLLVGLVTMRHFIVTGFLQLVSDPQRVRIALFAILLALALVSLLSGGAVLADGGGSGGHPVPTP